MAESPPDTTEAAREPLALMKLLRVTRELAGLHDLDEILKAVTEGTCDALDCERASLYLFDPDNEELCTRVVTELEIEEIRSTIEFGITGWVARRRKIANIPDPQVDARWNSAIDRQTGFTTRDILAGPVVSQHNDRLLGVLQLLNKREGSFDELDEQLLEAFASHAATALERAELMESVRQAHELEVAINVARQIQTSFLPDELPQVPGYDLATWWDPAELVSGDYYDVLELPDGRLALIVADVSGHGVGPSLIMASVRAMLKLLTARHSDVETIVSRLSAGITPDLHNGRFFTMLCAALDPKSHELAYVNAGQAPVLMFDRARREIDRLKPTGLPIGIPFEETHAAEEPRPLAPGDILIAATDGLTEVQNEIGDHFGRPRLEAVIKEHCEETAAEIVDAVQQAVAQFAPQRSYVDDVTLMVVKRNVD